MLSVMMSRNSAKMNDILAQPTANPTHLFTGHRGHMASSADQMMISPMVRSMSDASEIVRRPNLSSGIFANHEFGRSPVNCGISAFFTSSSSISEASDGSVSNGMFPMPPGHSVRAAQVEDEDYDLNMVFEEIGALQNKGLDESEDDSVGSFPSMVLQQQQRHQPQQSHVQSPLSQQQQPKQSQQHLASAPSHSAHPHQPATAVVHTSDGKVITYNPEIYNESDILLSNEKYPHNVRYLKDFRVEQCPLFLQHKCNQHKPFTCFYWHFANQRRRRPVRRRDGTFNYSPDAYCSKYDETTGICPDGEECPNLHRTAGDTERRYHLRYYKTGMCVYETDNRGFCVKNGPHCAFAHGQHDLRLPIFDSREQAQSEGEADGLINGHGLYDKDRNAVNEDPRWQDIAFVLANYKTELCKRPPRLCRQGYACPQFHNNKDRRRSPKKFSYRSTPCPSVKQGDEWGDPTNCEHDDACQYCHTRTEQQFHPEIYKSTKCNDIQQSNHCPRGPFCAFAHSESSDEIKAAREFSTDPNAEIPPAIISKSSNANTSPVDIARANSLSTYNRPSAMQSLVPSSLPDHFDVNTFDRSDLTAHQPQLTMNQHDQHGNGGCNLGPIARPRSFSTSNTKAMQPLPLSALLEKNNLLGKGNTSNNSLGSTIFSAASSTSSLFGMQEHQHQHQPSSSFSSTMMPNNFYAMPQESVTIDSVLNQIEDLSFESKLATSLGNANPPPATVDNHQMGVDIANSSLGSINMLRRSSLLADCSAPINIPANPIGPSISDGRSTSAAGFNLSPPQVGQMGNTSPLGSSFGPLASSFNGRQASASSSNATSLQSLYEFVAALQQLQAGPQAHNAATLALANKPDLAYNLAKELARLREENNVQKNQLYTLQNLNSMYVEKINEVAKKEKLAEKARDEAIDMLNSTQKELEMIRTNDNAFQRQHSNDINSLSMTQLYQLQHQIQQDLRSVEEAIQRAAI